MKWMNLKKSCSGGPISPTSWQQLHLLHNYNCCSSIRLYTCFSWAVWSTLSTLAHVVGRTRSPPLRFMIPWYLYVQIWCDKNDIQDIKKNNAQPNSGKIDFFVRLWMSFDGNSSLHVQNPIFSKKYQDQPKQSMSPRLVFHTNHEAPAISRVFGFAYWPQDPNVGPGAPAN